MSEGASPVPNPAGALYARVEARDRDVRIVLAGHLDGSSPSLEQAFAQALAAQPRRILLDFRAVQTINSKGLAVVVGLLAEARSRQIGLTACSLNEHYAEIFRITRLAEFMPLYADEAAAAADFP